MSKALTPEAIEVLGTVSLRCVECSALYAGIEAGWKPRYRCDCGGVLEMKSNLLKPQGTSSTSTAGTIDVFSSFEPDSDLVPPAGAILRQLFDERAATPPIWSISADSMLLDYSGVWRYRELILPVPEQYIVSRPEGNTGLYPVGRENCGNHRAGHRQIGHYAGLDYLFLKHEGENPTGSFKDRGMTVGVTMANLLGARAVACASTGNTSASLASYAAQLGLPCIV